MIDKYETFLKQQLEHSIGDSYNYWKRKYDSFLESLENGLVPEIDKSFDTHLQCIFNTGDNIQDVIAYIYDELPLLREKTITFGDTSILKCTFEDTITVDYDKKQILVRNEPILVNGYNLFYLTVGVV